MSTPFYDLEAIAEKAGLSSTHVPNSTEISKIKSEYFAASPGVAKEPDSQSASIKQVLGGRLAVNTLGRSAPKGSIFFRRTEPALGISSVVGSVDFDLLLEDETTYRVQVCQHPVQNGNPITDHIQPLPMTGRMKILVSNYSLRTAYGGADEGTWDKSRNRALEAYDALKKIMLGREPVRMVTVLESFMANDIVITRMTTPKTWESGDALTFEIEYTQIFKVAKLKTKTIDAVAKPANMNNNTNRLVAKDTVTGPQSPQDEDYTPGALPE